MYFHRWQYRCTLILALCAITCRARGDEADSAPPEADIVAPPAQIGDEPLKKFVPESPETDALKQQKQALAHFMAGRLHLDRGQIDEALQEYQAAIAADPSAIEPYKPALQILLQKNRQDEARKLAIAAAEKAPSGYLLLRAMAVVYAQKDELGKGIQLLKQGLELPSLKDTPLGLLEMHRDLGWLYRKHGDPREAAEQYQIVFEAITGEELDEAGRNQVLGDAAGQMLDEFGEVFLEAEKPELAVQAFEEANKHRPASPGVHSYNLATVFRQTGKPDQALKELDEYFNAQLQSKGRAAYALLKDLLQELQRGDELLPRLESLREKDPHNDVLRFFLADELLASDQLDRAEELYTNGKSTLTDPRALVGMLSIYRQRKDAAEMLETLTKAFQVIPRGQDEDMLQQLAPDVRDLSQQFETVLEAVLEDEASLDALMSYGRSQMEGDEPKLAFTQAYVLGKLSVEADRTDDAIAFYKFAISMRNDPPAQLYMELAQHLVDAEHYHEAVDLLSEAIAHPSNGMQREKWRFLWFMSFAYEFLGETDRAVELIREAQKLQPNFPRLFYHEAWIFSHARQYDRALELFDQVIQKYPGDGDLIRECRYRISNIYVEMGDMIQGEAVLEQVLRSDPDDPQANNDLGYLWADQGKNLEKAEAMIRRALAKEPENPAYLDSLGWVKFKQGDFAEAVVFLQKATTQPHGQDSTIFEHLGDALHKLQKEDEAQSFWRKALEIEEAKTNPSEKLLQSLKGKIQPPEDEDSGADPKPGMGCEKEDAPASSP